jgi:hypothetical protein
MLYLHQVTLYEIDWGIVFDERSALKPDYANVNLTKSSHLERHATLFVSSFRRCASLLCPDFFLVAYKRRCFAPSMVASSFLCLCLEVDLVWRRPSIVGDCGVALETAVPSCSCTN